MTDDFNPRGLAGFIARIKAQPYYFIGHYHSRVSEFATSLLLADAECLHAAEGVSLDGVLKHESGKQWKRFELLMPYTRITTDFAGATLSLDGKEVAEGLIYFFEGGFHANLNGPAFGLSAELNFEGHQILLNGMFKNDSTAYGISMKGGLSRPSDKPLGNVVSLRRNQPR